MPEEPLAPRKEGWGCCSTNHSDSVDVSVPVNSTGLGADIEPPVTSTGLPGVAMDEGIRLKHN
ncbi:hypothetical protein F2Q70_00023296 [Brassica cretica]|uniref:Uncharacterized protein n=2 Tax=Brassica cretica TaxID=69181 RepID=A0A8S9HH73_BRACR|nr:hypothetical protein F2Q70_00023296 [Brassica cretica]KAF2557359.1 hypothetical protein F2Q68_00017571 [Brassica cretica]KAF3605599.1 hypothetical protein DY000_02050394 [Brassica cretica]